MSTEEISHETKLQHIEEMLKARPDITYQQIMNELKEDGIIVNAPQIAKVKERMGTLKSYVASGITGKNREESEEVVSPDDEHLGNGDEKKVSRRGGSRKVKKRENRPVSGPPVKPAGNSVAKVMIDVDHFAVILEAAETVGSWRKLAEIAGSLADRLEGNE